MQAQTQYTAVDHQLNIVYKNLLRKLKPAERIKLQKSERAWIIYRDKEADSESAESIGGSIHPMEYTDDLITLTHQRIKQLQHWR